MQRLSFLLILILVQAYTSVCDSQVHIFSSKVVDAESGKSLPYVSVSSSSKVYTMSNSDGFFTISVEEKDTLFFRMAGYNELEVVVSSLPSQISLTPLTTTLSEVTVLPAEKILKEVSKRMKKDIREGKREKRRYYFRTKEQRQSVQIMKEGFLEANSTFSLQHIVPLVCRRLHDGRAYPLSANRSAMFDLMEIGAGKIHSKNWDGVVTPLAGDNYKKHYENRCFSYRAHDGKLLYMIQMKRKNKKFRNGVVEGVLYVDAENYRPVKFEANVPFMSSVFAGQFAHHKTISETSIVNNTFYIDYSSDKGFTEVANMHYTLYGGDGRSEVYGECLLVPVDHVELPETEKFSTETPWTAVISAGNIDSLLSRNHHVVQLTEDENASVSKQIVLPNFDNVNYSYKSDAKAIDKRMLFAGELQRFNMDYPQEKVFLHLDNTCYFLGDTIWFKAYTRQTDTGTPSMRSGVLYVELLNHDGYLVERKLIELDKGEGDGYFSLPADSSLYSGFYELRAYTRWQLNWGEYAHKKTLASRKWFFNKTMEYEYFRDYEKLYSRVFPVYDKPEAAGEYVLSMTERPKLRYYNMDPSEPEMSLSLFPEGGNLVAGVPCRVAFEAVMTDGAYLDGTLEVQGQEIPVVDRGRGVFTLTPRTGEEVTFRTSGGKTIRKTLPKAEVQGVSVQVLEAGNQWRIAVHPSAGFPVDSLSLTLMHEGRLVHYAPLSGKERSEVFLDKSKLQAGVHQVTLYDPSGRVWADRLFFVKKSGLHRPTLVFQGVKEDYTPYEPIELEVQGGRGDTHISVAVRDAVRGSRNDDTGNILTEMLLASEIRGFVPQPEWYFEADDDRHNRALDLLMMTQGWRRFSWQEMAVKGRFVPVHPVEKTPYIFGAVHTYEAAEKYSPLEASVLREHYRFMGMSKEMISHDISRKFGLRDTDGSRFYAGKDLTSGRWEKYADTLGLTKEQYRRWKGDGERLKNEVRVHGEVEYQGRTLMMEAKAEDGQFRFKTPKLYGDYYVYLQASDYSKWPADEKKYRDHLWLRYSEFSYPEFYVRIAYPYPKFVKPYHHYQTTHRPLEVKEDRALRSSLETTLQEVKVYASHGGLRRDKYMRPIVRLDAYEAFNRVVDAGLMDGWYASSATFSRALAQYHVGHMGLEGRYNVVNRLDNIYGDVHTAFRIGGMSVEEATKTFNRLTKLDSVFIFTDYSPRLEGDKRYYGSDQPAVSVLLKPGYTSAYRDRYIRMSGFAYPAEFYSPDYSKQTPPDSIKDYRRTLYWNPNVMLDHEGKARITLYNNARATRIRVDAAGQAADGTLMWGKE